MPSSKKQRGRQRKASAAASRAEDIRLQVPSSSSSPPPPRSWADISTSLAQLLTGLCQGDDDITWSVAAMIGEYSKVGFRRFMLDKDIIQIVLDFLIQCENSELQGVITNTPTPLSDPSPWLNILANITRDKWAIESETRKMRMHIARNFGPVVRCMCDAPGQFFKSNLYWFISVTQFTCLVSNLAETRDAIPDLLQYKGLIEFMVQSIFWESHRPDIVEEAGRVHVHSINFQGIIAQAKKFIYDLIYLDACREDVPDKSVCRCLKAIGTSRIAARSAKPVAGRKSELFVMYLIAHIKSKHLGKARNSEEGKIDYNFSVGTLESLMIGGCVDKDVIAGVISLAKHRPLDYDNVFSITAVMIKMLVPFGEVTGVDDNFDKPPYDNLFAYAVDQGLIEVCLSLLVMFKDDALKGWVEERYLQDFKCRAEEHLQDLSRFALKISMSTKSSKAFLRQHSQTTKMLQDAEAKLEGCSQQCQRIFQTMKMTMHLKDGIEHYATSKTCRCCGKVIIKDEIKQCGLCMNAVYCSRMCQEEDWGCGDALGHGSCCQDRHLNALEKNIHDVVNKLVAENKQNFLAQAMLMKYDILDCVVMINLRNATITLALPEDARSVLLLPESCDSFKKTFHRNRSSGYMTSMCVFYSCRVKREDSVVIMKHKLANDSWQAAQARFSKNGRLLDEIHRDQKVRESLGPFFCEWYHST